MADAPDDKKARALARLQMSRTAWQGIAQQGDHPGASQHPSGWQALASAPGISHVMDLVKAVWADSPLRLPAQLAHTQWRGVLAPMVRDHPWASVAVAAVAGFAITRHRHALMGLATGTLWPKLSPMAHAMVQTLLGMATSAVADQWLHAPGQTSTDADIANNAHHQA
jgi:disulfide bond formation protein DsbB